MARVLFVDDEQLWLQRYIDELKQDGHEVSEADNAEEAQSLLASFKPNLVVLDIMMPYESLVTLLRRGMEAVRNAPRQNVLGGIELYKVLQQQFSTVRVVILSVLSETEIRESAPEVEFTCKFLQKGGDDALTIYKTIAKELT